MPTQGTVQMPNSPVPLRMGKFKASKQVVKESWALLKQDKEIMWFPVLSALVSTLFFAALAAAYFFQVLGGNIENIDKVEGTYTDYVFLAAYYVATYFIVNFFQAGILVIAHGRFSGQDMSFGDGMRGASSKMGKILIWSLISATVGVILHAIADRSKIVGQIVAAILGAAWAILTYFSLPSLVIGQTTIINSFKESAALIRKTWGEALIVNVGVSLFFSMLMLLGLAIGVVLVIAIPETAMLIGVLIAFVLYVVVLSAIASALGVIFKLALYEYARTGIMPRGFSPELVQNAIKR